MPKTTRIYQHVPEILSGNSFPNLPDDLFY